MFSSWVNYWEPNGLLLLTRITEGTNQFMQVRLVAVKPGVILATVRSIWPVEDVSAWTRWLVNHLDPLFPKLGVAALDAVPISVFRTSGRQCDLRRSKTWNGN